MNTFWLSADDLLRGSQRASSASKNASEPGRAKTLESWRLARLVGQIAVFGALYGAAMGTFAVTVERAPQIVFAAVKVPLLLLATGALSVPLFAVLYSLWGLRAEWIPVLRALASTQAALSIVLASLSPLTLVVHASLPSGGSGYAASVLWNALIFAVAGLTAQIVLRAKMRFWIERDRRHVSLLRAWLLIYGFIGVQMAWVLRPFIGDPGGDVTFLRAQWSGNAYVALWKLIGLWIGL